MPRHTVTWKCLTALLAAPLAFACSSGNNTSPVDAAQPGVDARALVDAASALVDTAVVTPDAVPPVEALLAVDKAVNPDLPAVDSPAVDAAAPDLDAAQLAPDVSVDSTPDAIAEEVGLVCTIVPAFKGGVVTADMTLTRGCSPYAIDQQIRIEVRHIAFKMFRFLIVPAAGAAPDRADESQIGFRIKPQKK